MANKLVLFLKDKYLYHFWHELENMDKEMKEKKVKSKRL